MGNFLQDVGLVDREEAGSIMLRLSMWKWLVRMGVGMGQGQDAVFVEYSVYHLG
jgi:hypothetical protein